jgi:hypothetical protein
VKEMEVNSSIQRRRVKEISADHDWKLWETGKIQYPVIKRGYMEVLIGKSSNLMVGFPLPF